jgi:glycosyltransferase involved in cell wall biosynthesis
MARYLFGGPPLVHHEDGFNQDEADELKTVRNLYRRLALSAAHRLVVPSQQLEKIARAAWNQPPERIARIPNGIPVARFASGPQHDAIAGLSHGPGELVIGTVAGLRPVKNLQRLVRAFAAMRNKQAKLVIVGQGPESERIAGEARACGVSERLHMPGFLADPARYMGRFDIFALSSNSEQFPISLVEAMAAGLPVVATAVGDVASMVSDANRPLIVDASDEAGFTAALDSLSDRADLRRNLGATNRAKAREEFDEARMIARYAQLYGEAISAPRAFLPPAA